MNFIGFAAEVWRCVLMPVLTRVPLLMTMSVVMETRAALIDY